nr:MAG: hypothetical protein [Microviridae sp.]
MAFRHKMSRRHSKKNFRTGHKTRKRNSRPAVMRGGYRI